jgi:microsomal dipeptidase-like Zn-dependent dipeptidase
MVDVSHGSKQTALDAMRLSVAPIIASHSGVAAINAQLAASGLEPVPAH